MTKIKLKWPERLFNEADCQRIVEILADRGYEATVEQAWFLWKWRSDDWSASWLFLPADDTEVFEAIRDYFEETT